MRSSNTEFVNFIGDVAQEKEGGQEFASLDNVPGGADQLSESLLQSNPKNQKVLKKLDKVTLIIIRLTKRLLLS